MPVGGKKEAVPESLFCINYLSLLYIDVSNDSFIHYQDLISTQNIPINIVTKYKIFVTEVL
jgi:hypothetical protein